MLLKTWYFLTNTQESLALPYQTITAFPLQCIDRLSVVLGVDWTHDILSFSSRAWSVLVSVGGDDCVGTSSDCDFGALIWFWLWSTIVDASSGLHSAVCSSRGCFCALSDACSLLVSALSSRLHCDWGTVSDGVEESLIRDVPSSSLTSWSVSAATTEFDWHVFVTASAFELPTGFAFIFWSSVLVLVDVICSSGLRSVWKKEQITSK